MPVPAWAAIADSEIDEESPITESLMTRLRNQAAAVLGYDPTSATAPSFALPPSTQNVEGAALWRAVINSSATWATTAEEVVSVVADDVEDIQLGYPPAPYYSDTNANQACGVHVSRNTGTAGINIISIDVPYTSGNPTGVRVTVCSKVNSGTETVTQHTLPLDDAWTRILTLDTNKLLFDGKARATATHVYLSLRAQENDGAEDFGVAIRVPFVRKSFKSKT
jgi:hypothetical protein